MSEIQEILESLNGEIFGSANVGTRKIFDHKCSNIVELYNRNLGEFHKKKDDPNSWIKYGKDDQTPERHEEFARMSGLHRSAIITKSNLVEGAEIKATIPERFCKLNEDGVYEYDDTELSETELKEMEDRAYLFLKNINAYKYKSIAAKNLVLAGGYFPLMFYKLGADGKSMLEKVHIEQNRNCRLSSAMDYIGCDLVHEKLYLHDCFVSANITQVIDYVEFKKDKDNKKKRNYIKSVPYDTGTLVGTDEFGVRYRMIGERDSNFRQYYPTPDYESRKFFEDCSTDYRMSVKTNKGATDGFSLKYIIVRNRAKITDESKEKQQKEADLKLIRKNHKGAFGEDSMMVWVAPAKDDTGKPIIVPPITIIPIPQNDSAEMNSKAKQDSANGIQSGHGIIASELMGLNAASAKGFSNVADYIVTAIEQLHWGRTRKLQKHIEQHLTDLAQQSGIRVEYKIEPSRPALRQLTEKLLLEICDNDEIREMFGKQPLTDDQKEAIVERASLKINTPQPNE